LINTDAFLTPGCLERMLERMDADPRAGAVGPRLVFGDGSWQRSTGGRAPGVWPAFNYYLFLDRLLPEVPVFRGLYLGHDVRISRTVDWVCSACMLLRRAALDEVGLLDERIFVYMDDVDLCQRLWAGGWNVWYCGEVEAVHYMSATTEGPSGSFSPAKIRSFNRYFALRHSVPETLALRLIQVAGFGARSTLYLAVALLRGNDRRLRARARGYWDYVKVSLEDPIDF
jgi:GT2 family glycosyltransferase